MRAAVGSGTPGGPQLLQLSFLPHPLLGQALVEGDARLPTEVTAELGGVGEGVALVASAGRLQAGERPPAAQSLEPVEDVPDGRGLAAADVVELAGVGFDRGDVAQTQSAM